MARPGTDITVLTTPPPVSAPTDTGVAFVVGLSDAGPLRPLSVRSMTDFMRLFGPRVSYSVLYDAMDTFFHEGGDTAYVSRVVGPGATQATLNLQDNASATSLVVKALGPGAGTSPTGGNFLKVGVAAGTASGTYQIQVTDANGIPLENSYDLITQADGVSWSIAYSSYISASIGASSLPPKVSAPALLSGGADDRASITDADWLAALNRFGKDIGPGQVIAPGRTSDVGHTQLLDHAYANNRTALLDLPDSPTVSTLTTSAANAKSTGHGQYGAAFTPWPLVPGVLPGTTRTVPPSAAVAGAMARVDASDNPNTPAAGDLGVLRYATGLSQPAWDGATRTQLNNAGVDVIRQLYGTFRIYGYRSLADPINNPSWLDLSNVRYLMSLAARCQVAGETFVFDVIDGQGKTIGSYGASMSAICQGDWVNGMIYGASPSDAFNVDVSDTVNTPQTIANNELHAVVAVKPSPFAEWVQISIVNVPVSQAVS